MRRVRDTVETEYDDNGAPRRITRRGRLRFDVVPLDRTQLREMCPTPPPGMRRTRRDVWWNPDTPLPGGWLDYDVTDEAVPAVTPDDGDVPVVVG